MNKICHSCQQPIEGKVYLSIKFKPLCRTCSSNDLIRFLHEEDRKDKHPKFKRPREPWEQYLKVKAQGDIILIPYEDYKLSRLNYRDILDELTTHNRLPIVRLKNTPLVVVNLVSQKLLDTYKEVKYDIFPTPLVDTWLRWHKDHGYKVKVIQKPPTLAQKPPTRVKISKSHVDILYNRLLDLWKREITLELTPTKKKIERLNKDKELYELDKIIRELEEKIARLEE